MNTILTIIIFILVFAIALSLIGLWNMNTDMPSDEELYGMSGEEYLKKQVGEDYYNKYYK